MTTCDLSIIIVTWNVADLVQACLQSIAGVSRGDPSGLRRFGPPDMARWLEVIVVDNASEDGTVPALATRFPWVTVLASDTNLGFTAGNNRGYAASRGQYIYFLNPDTEIVGSGAVTNSLWTLYAAVEADPSIGIAGPALYYGDGSLQSSRRRFPTSMTGYFESTWLRPAVAVESMGAASTHGGSATDRSPRRGLVGGCGHVGAAKRAGDGV